MTLSFTLVCLVFGVLLATGLRSPTAQSLGRSGSDRDISAGTITRLETEQKSLKGEISKLQTEIEAYQKLSISRKETLEGLSGELESQKMLAGVVPVIGDGVRVLLDDSSRTPLPDDDPANYIVHEYQVRDIVNMLWQAGAEAVAINDERVVSLTSVYCVGSTIIVNSTRLSPPYQVSATGDANGLHDYLDNANILRKFKSQANFTISSSGLKRPRTSCFPHIRGQST